MYEWFDPETPQIPAQAALPAARTQGLRDLVATLRLPPTGGPHPHDQVEAIINGLDARVQLIQGPPGTGKTTTGASAILSRILARRSVGDIVLIAAHTHTAVNKLLTRLDETLPAFTLHVHSRGMGMPPVRLAKVHSSAVDPEVSPGGTVVDFPAKPSARNVKRMREDAVLVVGGTTSAILKLARELSQRQPFATQPNGFQVPVLVVDEASMMVFPHFLALASLVTQNGEIMVAGDHRQLSPIIAHDWEREDRPPAVLYQPFASAYDAIQRIKGQPGISDAAILRSPLRFTFRLPPEVLELISRLYRLDDIELEGPARPALPGGGVPTTDWNAVWRGATGLFLVVHNERESRQANEVELRIVEQVLAASGVQPDGSIAIVTPHRAQRSFMKTRLARFLGPVDVIDTVERLQGDERPTVIVSATASDPAAIGKSVAFILDLNRANVAFSRTRDRLIVVCSDTLLDHMPVEVEHYESAMLWKSLRALCTEEVARMNVPGADVRVLTIPQAQRRALFPDGPAPSPTSEDASGAPGDARNPGGAAEAV
jgi:DNA polymerase III delta prime subunit